MRVHVISLNMKRLNLSVCNKNIYCIYFPEKMQQIKSSLRMKHLSPYNKNVYCVGFCPKFMQQIKPLGLSQNPEIYVPLPVQASNDTQAPSFLRWWHGSNKDSENENQW